jgi:hypothetical protein
MNEDRIKAAQAEIQKDLPPRPEYVVSTSEFDTVKARLAMMHNRRKVDNEDPNRPRLRRGPGTGGSGTGDANGGKTDDSDDRPTLKRRDN